MDIKEVILAKMVNMTMDIVVVTKGIVGRYEKGYTDGHGKEYNGGYERRDGSGHDFDGRYGGVGYMVVAIQEVIG